MSVATANYSRAALRTEAMQKCWRHTLASAILSREVARVAGMPPEQAYSLGLLHDIGRLGLLVAWPDDYNHILQEADRESVLLLDLEKRLFTMDHCEVGRRLVEQWKLPPEFLVVAGRHHDAPAGSTEFDGLRIVSLACRMADALGYWVAKPLREEGLEAILAELPADMRERFPADPEALKQLVESSVTGGAEALNQQAPDYVQSPRVRVPLEERRPAEDREAISSPEVSSIMWDFAIVVTTILTFMAVIIALHYYRT
jgi:putative nucleotidyltransferase with HDIG domain